MNVYYPLGVNSVVYITARYTGVLSERYKGALWLVSRFRCPGVRVCIATLPIRKAFISVVMVSRCAGVLPIGKALFKGELGCWGVRVCGCVVVGVCGCAYLER